MLGGLDPNHIPDGFWYNNGGSVYLLIGGYTATNLFCGYESYGLFNAVWGSYWFIETICDIPDSFYYMNDRVAYPFVGCRAESYQCGMSAFYGVDTLARIYHGLVASLSFIPDGFWCNINGNAYMLVMGGDDNSFLACGHLAHSAAVHRGDHIWFIAHKPVHF